MPKRSAWQIMGLSEDKTMPSTKDIIESSAPTNLLVSEEPTGPADGKSEDEKEQGQGIALLDTVHLRQDIGCGDGQKSAGGYANGNGDIFRRQRAEK